jgi:hypothetical protein
MDRIRSNNERGYGMRSKEELRQLYNDFIGRNDKYCGLVNYNKIPKVFIESFNGVEK